MRTNFGDTADEVKNEDDDNDDASHRELDDGAKDSRHHGVGIGPADPPDVKLCLAVEQVVAVWNADDQQQASCHSLCLKKNGKKSNQSIRLSSKFVLHVDVQYKLYYRKPCLDGLYISSEIRRARQTKINTL